MLIDGMASAMEEKALIKGSSLKALDDEIIELDVMIGVLSGKGPIQDIFVGLNILAKHLFIEVRKEIVKSPEFSLQFLCKKIGYSFVEAVKYAEEYHLGLNNTDESLDNVSSITLVAKWVTENYPNYN